MPASFNFPQREVLSLSFILFAGWFADALRAAVGVSQLALAGLVTFFGSSTRQSRFCSPCFVFRAIRSSCFWRGCHNSAWVRSWRRCNTLTCGVARSLRRHGPSSLAARTASVVRRHHGNHGDRRHRCTRLFFAAGLPRSIEGHSAGLDATSSGAVRATVARTPSPAPPHTCTRSRRSTSARFYASGTCPTRCHSLSSIRAGDLVGFDIELAHRLAREMGVGLAFVPVDRGSGEATRGGVLRM